MPPGYGDRHPGNIYPARDGFAVDMTQLARSVERVMEARGYRPKDPLWAATTDEGAGEEVDSLQDIIRPTDEELRMAAQMRADEARMMAETADPDVAAMIDMDSAEVCNLDAVAVRRQLLSKFNIRTMVEKRQYYPGRGAGYDLSESTEFNELVYENGVIKASTYADAKHPRVVSVIRYLEGGLPLIAWCDLETESVKPLLRKARDVPKTRPEDVDHLPITIGFESPYGKIALVKSIKSMTGCHVVMPNGQEIEAGQYNKPVLLSLLSEIVCDDSGKFGDFLRELQGTDDVREDPVVAFVQSIIERRLDPAAGGYHRKLKDFIGLLSPELTDHLNLRTDPSSNGLTAVSVVAQSPEGSYELTVNGTKKHGSRKLGIRNYVDPTTLLVTTELTLYAGLDENRYGVENAIAYPQFVYRSDFVNTPQLYKVGVSGDEVPAGELGTEEFLKRLRTLQYKKNRNGWMDLIKIPA